MIALSVDPLDFAYLPSPSGCLNVLEMNLRVFTQVHNRAKMINSRGLEKGPR